MCPWKVLISIFGPARRKCNLYTDSCVDHVTKYCQFYRLNHFCITHVTSVWSYFLIFLCVWQLCSGCNSCLSFFHANYSQILLCAISMLRRYMHMHGSVVCFLSKQGIHSQLNTLCPSLASYADILKGFVMYSWAMNVHAAGMLHNPPGMSA